MQKIVLISTTLWALSTLSVFGGTELPSGRFDQAVTQLRFDNSISSQKFLQTGEARLPAGKSGQRHLSPGKSFAMSLLLPGLGQYYNGNKVKAAGFLALDITSWILHFKAHSDGNKLTNEFETFQQTHWSQTRYEDYLDSAYGFRDDDSIRATEVSHHLPDSRTQQYYEMTGKYDQFSWGWDDARLNGLSLYELDTVQPAVGAFIPGSANRFIYEDMRKSANDKFDAADRWLIVAMANRVISAFEAMISAKRHNKNATTTGTFGRVKFRADMRSFAAVYDTPYLRCTYAF